MNTNQIIHERLMGGCWHITVEDVSADPKYGTAYKCSICGAGRWGSSGRPEFNRPNYRADLNLAFAAQAKAIERFGIESYCSALILQMQSQLQYPFMLIEVNAKQRCAAIVKLLEDEK